MAQRKKLQKPVNTYKFTKRQTEAIRNALVGQIEDSCQEVIDRVRDFLDEIKLPDALPGRLTKNGERAMHKDFGEVLIAPNTWRPACDSSVQTAIITEHLEVYVSPFKELSVDGMPVIGKEEK